MSKLLVGFNNSGILKAPATSGDWYAVAAKLAYGIVLNVVAAKEAVSLC